MARLGDLASGGIARLRNAISDARWPELALLAGAFLAEAPRVLPHVETLLQSLAAVPLAVQPCLRDVWHDHILFTGDTVTGIIDFGAVDFDTPATDLARLLGSLVGDDPVGWQTGLAAYSAVRPLSPDDVCAVRALDLSGTLLAGCNWIRWIYIERREFENHAQVISRFARLVERLRAM